MTVEDQRAQLASQIAEPVFTESMTRAERLAEMDRWHAERQAESERLDEEHQLLGIGRTAAISMTHELIWSWHTATSSRWFLALPERYMTPDSMTRPDWNHSHYPHDEYGHIGRVTTRERPKTQEDTRQEKLIAAILADIASDPELCQTRFKVGIDEDLLKSHHKSRSAKGVRPGPHPPGERGHLD